MRKTLSIILTAAMLLSVLAAIPFSAGAESAAAAMYAKTTFETEAEQYFHTNNRSAATVEKADDTQGYAAKLDTFVSAGNGATAWPSSIRISQTAADGTVSAFKVKAGATYDLAFKMWIESLDSSFNIPYFYILYGNENNGRYILGGSCSVNDYSLKNGLWTDKTPEMRKGWYSFKFTFTAPANIGSQDEIFLLPVIEGNGAWKNAGIAWVDDIIIGESNLNKTFADFENTDEFLNISANYNGASVADTGDDNYGKAIKFTQIGSYGGNDNFGMWPHAIKIPASNNFGPFKVKNGETYQISFDIKRVTATVDFDLYAYYSITDNKINKIGYRDYTSNWSAKKAKIANFTKGTADWTHITANLTVSALKELSDLTFVLYNTAWGNVGSQEIYIDNVEVKKTTVALTVHTSASETKTITAKCDADLSTVNVPMAGARFKGLYLDAALTEPATGTVGYEPRELWAAFESVTGDFENGNALAGTLYDGGWSVLPYVGVDNSSALTDYKEGGTPSTNSAWPPVLKLLNTDGSDFLTYSGHEYLISFDMKVDNPSLIPERAALALVYSKPAYPTDGNFTTTYPLLDNERYTESKVPIKYGYQNSDGTYGTTGWYRHYEFRIEGLDNGLPVYITPWQALTFTYFDNFKIIDLTSQIAVTDDNGNELAKGYAGESVSVPAADGNFICYEKSGEPVTNVTVNYSDNELSKVTSQIAVTETAADTENKTISFKAGFEGLEYTAVGENITVKNAIIDGKRYGIAEIGLLVLPDEKLSGELTLKNYEALGAQKLSNSNLKYSTAADNRLEVTAVISTNSFNRDYTVVGYIKCANGRVLYSKTRYGINRNLAAAAGLDSIADNAAYGKYGYTLATNSEFNSADTADIFKNWNIWGHSRTTDGVTAYSTVDAVSADGENMVMTVARDSDSAFRIPYMLSRQHFTTGYLEVRAKLSDFADIGGCIWLNSAGISETEYKYPSNDTDNYVHPELDIVEFDNNTKFYSTLHSWGSDGSQRHQIRLNPLSDPKAVDKSLSLNEWHTYGFERTADAMKTYVDGELVYEYTLEQALKDCRENKKEGDYLYRTVNEVKALFENPTYLILSLSADTLKTGESAESLIDYVRFYK